jgi:hypothetical protein
VINAGIGGPIYVRPTGDYTGFTKLWDGATRTPGQHHVHYAGSGAIMRDFSQCS